MPAALTPRIGRCTEYRDFRGFRVPSFMEGAWKLEDGDLSYVGVSPNREAAIWARLMQVHGDDLSPEVAAYLLSIGFGAGDRDRMQQLAARSESGTLTEEELAEFDSYLHVGNLACSHAVEGELHS